MNQLKLKLIAGALAVACAGSAHALQITQTHSFSNALTNWSSSFAFNQFDNSGGKVLDSITFKVDTAVQGSVQTQDTSGAGGPYDLTGYLQGDVYLGLTNYGNNGNAWSHGSYLLDAYASKEMTWLGVPTQTLKDTGTMNTAGADVTVNSGSLFSTFQGTGTTTLYTAAIGSSGASGSGNLQTTTNIYSDSVLKEIYTYHTITVPEPATMLLAGLALTGVAVSRRARKA